MPRPSRLLRLAVPLIVLTGALAAATPADDEISGDLKLLQGNWSATSADGTPVTFEFDQKNGPASPRG